jgi:endonuclease YncB( thermonuclease family)
MKAFHFLFFIILFLVSPVHAVEYEGKVVGVSDGDTLTVLDSSKTQHKIRLHQIDAPEKNQDYGQRSKQSLSDLVYGKQVTVSVVTTDKYGRKVGKVTVNGTDANLEQVKRGMAWVYKQYASDPAYFAAEDEARKAKVGLWSQPNPTPPWEFRHGGKSQSVGDSDLKKYDKKTKSKGSFKCGGKSKCGDMFSCDEAKLYLNNCGLSRLDGDKDGIPCEALCK